jgi:hypothetical protein
MAANNSKFLPELDERAFARNQKTAWLLYLDKLTVWLWKDCPLDADPGRRPPSRVCQPPAQDRRRTETSGDPPIESETRARSRVRYVLSYYHLPASEHRGA